MTGKASGGGPLVAIGGHEDKDGARAILRHVAGLCGGRPLVVATLATRKPAESFDAYADAFAAIGHPVRHLDLDSRDDAFAGRAAACLDGAGGLFFTGGSQARITRKIAGTPVGAALAAMHRAGGVVAGTSAGASVLGAAMMTGRAVRPGTPGMVPGLGLVPGWTIDQHFAQRRRHGRLIAALASRPDLRGMGVDEDTAAVVHGGTITVIGAGAATIMVPVNTPGEGERFAARIVVARAGDSLRATDA